MGDAWGRPHVGVKCYVGIIFIILFFLINEPTAQRQPPESSLLRSKRVLIPFSAFRAFLTIKIRGLGFLTPKPSKIDPLMGFSCINKNFEYLENGYR